jgi:threonine/homoserine/homoserine lactone efflux protein
MLFVIGQTLRAGRGGASRRCSGFFGRRAGACGDGGFGRRGAARGLAGAVRRAAVAGAGYLLWLAYGALRSAWRGGGRCGRRRPARAAFRDGFLTNLTNPKVVLFFLAFLPQFVDPARGPAWLQMAILGPLVPLMAMPAYSLLIAGADRAAARLSAFSRWLDGIAGVLFLALGLRLLLGQRPA